MKTYSQFITEAKKISNPSSVDVENWVRDSLSGIKRTTTKDIMRGLFKKAFTGSTKIFDEVWDDLIDDGFLVKVSGNKFKWEM